MINNQLIYKPERVKVRFRPSKKLKNLLIKLPDSKIDKALENLKNLFVNEKVLQSNIIEIDLRIEGRASLKVDEGKINYGLNDI
mgnify:CR=1 FL=1